MGGKTGKYDTTEPSDEAMPWRPAVRVLVSLAVLFQMAAVLAGALAAPPASPLEREVAELFAVYHQVTDLRYSYRYYAPEPGPTPVATATIRYADGRPEETVRIPDRGVRPLLRYQRQLALANHLAADFAEVQAARLATGKDFESRWARSYARHLARSRSGCASITLKLQSHLIPDPDRIRQALAEPGAKRIDLDDEEFYTAPERIGEFPCDGL